MWLALASVAQAATQRLAFLVANNVGGPGTQPLYFAEDDARKVAHTLEDSAGYHRDDVFLVEGERKTDVLRAFGDLKDEIAVHQGNGDDVVLFFYYSGHADDRGLHLQQTQLAYDELDTLLERSGADVRMAFLDACHSGAATRRKGGNMAPSFVFDVSERLATAGTVIITSSSSDEASQESDEIAGSYFTHWLTSAIAGAADEDGDERVTLSEVYDYVYIQTILDTAASSLGTQHPTFEWDLSGEGDVVVSDLAPASSSLIFPTQLSGTYAVFDLQRSTFVGEVTPGAHDRKLAVRPGRYLVQVRRPTHLYTAEVTVPREGSFNLAHAVFEPVEYENDTAKGRVEKQVRKAHRPDSSVRMLLGVGGPANLQVAQQYLPYVPMGGLSYRAKSKSGTRFWGLDTTGGAGPGTISIPGVTAAGVPLFSTWATGSVNLGAATPEWHGLQAGGGFRLSAIYARRSFWDENMAPDQSILTPAPGGMWFAGWHPGRFVIELERHYNLVPYRISDERAAFVATGLYLSVGMHW
jgi:hypothetical protein